MTYRKWRQKWEKLRIPIITLHFVVMIMMMVFAKLMPNRQLRPTPVEYKAFEQKVQADIDRSLKNSAPKVYKEIMAEREKAKKDSI